MAPLVWGERETMHQMMWYNVILIALTVLPVTFGAFGIIYLVSAAVLGAILLVGVIRVQHERRMDRAGVVGLQVLAALPRAALRRDGR